MTTQRPGPARLVGTWLRVLVGSVLIAGVLGFAAERWFYVIPLYSLLIGMIGGLFARTIGEMYSSELYDSRLMALAGVAASLLLFVLVQYIRYRIAVIDLASRPGWWEHLVDSAGRTNLGRLGREGVGVGPILAWGSRAVDLGFALASGGYVAMKMDLPPEDAAGSRRR